MKATVTNSDDTTDIKSAQITISINIVPEPDEDPVFFLNDSTDIDMNQKTHQFHSVGTELYVISAKDRDKLTSSIEYFASSSSDYFEVAGAASIDDFYGTISDKIVVKTKKPLINAM